MKFYFVSENPTLDKTILEPRVPLNKMNDEDSEVKRICVSSSIAGCLLATPRYEENDIVYVYQCESNNYKQPNCDEVPDAPLTGEIWILEPVKLNYFTKLRVKNVSDFSKEIDLQFDFFDFE